MNRLLTLPDRKGWLISGLIFLCFTITAALFSLETGLLVWQPDGKGIIAVALVALVLPSIAEELVFRAPLLWAPKNQTPLWSILLLAAFILWHPINAQVFLPQAQSLFDDPRFLVIAGALGLACSATTLITRSIVPGILMHWLTVLGWKGLFGGDQYLAV